MWYIVMRCLSVRPSRSWIVPKRIQIFSKLILCTSKSEAAVASNKKKLCCRYVEADYRQTWSIAQPLCDSRATCGISGAGFSWRHSYLTDRSQCVRAGMSSSTYKQCSSGLPQGSILSPLLFTAYISPFLTSHPTLASPCSTTPTIHSSTNLIPHITWPPTVTLQNHASDFYIPGSVTTG